MDWTSDNFIFIDNLKDLEINKSFNYEKENNNTELDNLYIELKIKLIYDIFYNKNNYCCWCCNNYIVIHPSNIDNFIKKYIKDENNNKDKLRYSSLLIKILYRLHLEYFDIYDISKIKYINGLVKTYLSNDSYLYIYDIYFKSENKDLTNLDYYTCTICKNSLCAQHMMFNPFYSSKCKYCDNHWNICIWCKTHKLKIFFENNHNEFEYDKSMCNIYHVRKNSLS